MIEKVSILEQDAFVIILQQNPFFCVIHSEK